MSLAGVNFPCVPGKAGYSTTVSSHNQECIHLDGEEEGSGPFPTALASTDCRAYEFFYSPLLLAPLPPVRFFLSHYGRAVPAVQVGLLLRLSELECKIGKGRAGRLASTHQSRSRLGARVRDVRA